MRRPSKLEGFTHNRAVLRLPGFAGLSDSKDCARKPTLSVGFRISPDTLSGVERNQQYRRRKAG